MSTIYSISNWDENSVVYALHAIVRYENRYYYAIKAHTSDSTPPPNNSEYWGGYGLNSSGQTKPKFLWKPSYGGSHSFEPRLKTISFGDGYTQDSPDGIHNTLWKSELVFEMRRDAECRAINHFLYTRGGQESFLYTPTSPFGTTITVKCKKWDTDPTFFDNFLVRASFEEVPI